MVYKPVSRMMGTWGTGNATTSGGSELPTRRVITDTAVATAASKSSSPAVRAAVITSGGKRKEAVDETAGGISRISNLNIRHMVQVEMDVESVRILVVFNNYGVVKLGDYLAHHMATMLMFLVPLPALHGYGNDDLRQCAPEQFGSCHVVAIDKVLLGEQRQFSGCTEPLGRCHDTSRTEKPNIRSMNPVEMSQSSSTSWAGIARTIPLVRAKSAQPNADMKPRCSGCAVAIRRPAA